MTRTSRSSAASIRGRSDDRRPRCGRKSGPTSARCWRRRWKEAKAPMSRRSSSSQRVPRRNVLYVLVYADSGRQRRRRRHFCANTEDTQRVIGQRQLTLLRELAARTVAAKTWQQACEISIEALATVLRDLPFAVLYILDADDGSCRHVSSFGVAQDHPAFPAILPVADDRGWPLAKALQEHSSSTSARSPGFSARISPVAHGIGRRIAPS